MPKPDRFEAAVLLRLTQQVPVHDTTRHQPVVSPERCGGELHYPSGGKHLAEVAHRLGLSAKTVRNNVSAILVKLHLGSRAEAIAVARDHGLGRRARPRRPGL